MAEGDQYQQPSLGDPSSIECLQGQAILMLENECLALEKEYERKKADNAALRRTIEEHDKNNLKMQAEVEQLKVKIHKEIMGRSACEAKLNTLHRECEDLDKTLSLYCKGVNNLLKTIERQKEILKQKGLLSKKNEARCNQIEENYQRVLGLSSQTAEELSKLKTHEKNQFDSIICHLKGEIREKKEQESLLNERFRQVDIRCKETETKIKMLLPQKAELEKMVSTLKSEMARQEKGFEEEDASLKAALQEEAEKKIKFTEEIKNIEKNIDDTNVIIREQENQAKELESTMKQLISEIDELDQSNKSEIEEINKLAQEVEEKTLTYASLAAIDEENALLIKKRDSLQEINADLEEKIKDKKKTEEAYNIQLEKIDKFMQDMEAETGLVINHKLAIEERVKHKELEITKIKHQHKENCAQLDKEHCTLYEKNEELQKTITESDKIFSNLEKEKEKLENDLIPLKAQFNLSKKKRDDSFDECSGFLREKEAVAKQLREEIKNLEDAVGWSSREAEKAIEDTKEHKKITERIDQLEKELERLQVEHDSALEQIHTENSKNIEEKQKSLKVIRAQKEGEFRRKEMAKTNIRIELVENKKFIEELEKSKQLTEKEIKKTDANLQKCQKLVRALNEKLASVVRVASNSQSTVSSQVSNLLNTPKCNAGKQFVYNSPPSDSSSAITINPDDVALFKQKNKKQISKSNSAKKTPPRRKNKKYEDDDDWNF